MKKAHSDLRLKELLQSAESAARKAGAILLQRPEVYGNICLQDAFDIKLQADMDSETLIREQFACDTPDFGIVGEEEGGETSLMESDQPYWIIDPLDGTYNYSRNTPVCAVSIGLMRGLDSLLGVIYDFNTDTMYSGIPGEGFTVNGKLHTPIWSQDMQQGCIYTGFTASRDPSTEAMLRSLQRIQKFKKVRMIGSAAIGLAQVALGYGDLYFEEHTHLWDIAAGVALIEAAGGTWRFELNNKKPFQGIVAAGDPQYVEAIK
jgi:myo-inositol-1(or 4)-monophosphatase